jgi:hypothetical protein
MNHRERVLALIVVAVIIALGGGYLFNSLLLAPLDDREASIRQVNDEIDKKLSRINEVNRERPKLERWRQMSLPADVDLAQREYERYLTDLMSMSGFPPGSYSVLPRPVDTKSGPTLGGKNTPPIYTRLTFGLQAHTTLDNLIKMLDRFYRTGLMHQVKNLTIQRPITGPGPQQQQAQNELEISMTVDALIINGSGQRNMLLPAIEPRLLMAHAAEALRGGPAGLALAAWAAGPTGPAGPRVLADLPRKYTAIAAKNIFLGPTDQPGQQGEEVIVTRYVRLVAIDSSERRIEGWLYNRYDNVYIRLRTERPFDTFPYPVNDAEGEPLFRCRVVRLTEHEMVFQCLDKKGDPLDSKFYLMHPGASLEEAMKASLNDKQKKELGLVTTVAATSKAVR